MLVQHVGKLLAVLFAVLPLCASAQTAPDECIVLTREGKVDHSRAGGQWSAVETNQVLKAGDRLRTGLRSRATLRWSDLSVLRVDQLTSMEISAPAKPDAKSQLELRSGSAYLFSREKPMDIQFRTPVASGAIRGTELHIQVAEDGQTRVAVLNGEVELANEQGAAVLRSGDQGAVEAGKAPVKTSMLEGVNIIQWALYYPAVVDLADLNFSPGEAQKLNSSVSEYRKGALANALANYSDGRRPDSDSERAYLAALLLPAGRVNEAQDLVAAVRRDYEPARAITEVIAATKNQRLDDLKVPATSSGWIARSYYLQMQGQLEQARDAARKATTISPEFGAGWARLAELEFGFGNRRSAEQALANALKFSPLNAQAITLNAFMMAGRNDSRAALAEFDRAIAVDGSLANAWLGRGLIKRKLAGRYLMGERREEMERSGREDLQVAAALEPQRGVLRSYLGKAFADDHDVKRAHKELKLAKELDPNDPTAWLYSAILSQQENDLNAAIDELEKSKDLNENRSIFRSEFLLDQDQAVRSANLASIYRDVGMFERSVQEASRAVTYDYANYSAHLFLANSYDTLRDPKLINLRYETPWFSELLLANLLAPVNGGSLSRSVSQQDYSQLFATDGLGIFSQTEYYSSGDWVQNASQYGVFGDTAYAFDAYYRSENGQRQNNSLEQLDLSLRLKQQLTDKDKIFLQVGYLELSSGDLAQYYDQDYSSPNFHAEETQEPSLLVGYHREWSQGVHTLFLFNRIDDELSLTDSGIPRLARNRYTVNTGTELIEVDSIGLLNDFDYSYNRQLDAYSAELQQVWQTHSQTLVAGLRYQTASADVESALFRPGIPGNPLSVSINSAQQVDADLDRFTVYGYETVRILDNLSLIGGLTYDYLEYPANIDIAPILDDQQDTDQLSPKVGISWSPFKETNLRGAYTRSLGGVYFDQSVRLEPVQVAGFNQAFRSLVPESVAGLVPGTEFETFGLGLDQRIEKTRTYLFAQAELLTSEASRSVGILTNDVLSSTPLTPNLVSGTPQSLDYQEQTLLLAVNQLLGDNFSVGARYRLTEGELETTLTDIPSTALGIDNLNQDVEATLHQVTLFGNYYHLRGYFAQLEAVYSQQSNRGYTPDLAGDEFWQGNVFVGYRFLQRRAEARVGLLNVGDRDYKLNPLTLYSELPRERTFFASLKLNF